MQELPSIERVEALPPAYPQASVVTIGNFDGCHLGHQALAAAARAYQQKLGLKLLAMTFDPRPQVFFKGPGDEEDALFSAALKKQAFAELGFDGLLVQKFHREFSHTGHEEFYSLILKGYLQAKAIVVGENFQFGYKRGGDASWLVKRAQDDGVQVTVAAPVNHGGSAISSTRIRQALRTTQVTEANAMLGRPYLLCGHIGQGDQLGRSLGVPTANLHGVCQLIPAYGIYAGYVWLEKISAAQTPTPGIFPVSSTLIPAVYSLGLRPTLRQARPSLSIEAHLLQGSYQLDELYGQKAGFYFTHYLRPEQRFANLQALQQQMHSDIAAARALLQIP